MKVSDTAISQAILALQDALGERPEGMASRIGCSYFAYTQWLRGDRFPSGEWLIKMLRLCPDEETRRRFWAQTDKKVLDNVNRKGSKMQATRPLRLDGRIEPRFKRPKTERKK